MKSSLISKFKYYLDIDETSMAYPYIAVDNDINQRIRDFRSQEEAEIWISLQNQSPTFGEDCIPPFLRIMHE